MVNFYSVIFGSLTLLIQLYSEKYRTDNLGLTLSELEKDDNLPRIKIYDFIVVGGGGAGCVIAYRLSKHYNVLLLEAGGTPPPATRVPLFYDSSRTDPSIHYIYNSVPQKYASLYYGGNIRKAYGKMLGGSTSYNGFVYNRGNPLDYDNWATITNDTSWKYKNILKYFKISEHFIGHESPQDIENKQHGYFGPLTVETVDVPFRAAWLDAGAELGFETTLDPNGPQIESFSANAATTKKGQRVSTYSAFIEPFENIRKKLRIERYSEVSQVLIDDRHKRAYGVAYRRHGIPQIAHSSKEVIISCGAIGSPLLLIKSGIGPSSTLKNAKIQLIKDLPVGNTLVDHNSVYFGPFSFSKSSKLTPLEFVLDEKSLTEYHDERRGILSNRGIEAQAFIVSSRAKREGQPTWPDIRLNWSVTHSRYPSQNVVVGVNRPKSRGTVMLNTTAYSSGITNDEELALVDYNIFSDPSDVDVLLEGIKLLLNTIENTNTFQKLGGNYTGVKLPSCNMYQFRSDEYWRCFIHQMGSTASHPMGTCKMGFGEKDKSAVVDSKFNVLGVSNLKIVDASVMPMIPNANLQAPTIMIAEKASHEILKSWKIKTSSILNQ